MGSAILGFDVKPISQAEEASRARSEDEFISKIEQCAQEADESQLWLELLQYDCGVAATSVEPVWRESNELIAIFITMSKNTKSRLNRES